MGGRLTRAEAHLDSPRPGAFPEARAPVRPVMGSALRTVRAAQAWGGHLAEPERSVRARSCLHGRRIGDRSTLRSGIAARVKAGNGRQAGEVSEWRIDGARDKFRCRHPEVGSRPSTGWASPLSGNATLEMLSLEVLPWQPFLERLWADEFID